MLQIQEGLWKEKGEAIGESKTIYDRKLDYPISEGDVVIYW